jgi:hypothetical protein
MTTDTSDDKTKVLVNVYEPLIILMKRKLDAACMKRDAYLDRALRLEAGFLKEEVLLPNSDKAKSFITDNLRALRLKPLNLLLSVKTVELINEACKEKNIPRDVFVNRFLLLLIASEQVISAIFCSLLEGFYPDGWEDAWYEWRSESYHEARFYFDLPNVMDTIEEFVEISPFWRIRDFFSCYQEDWKLYGYPFQKSALNALPDAYKDVGIKIDNALGFNTYMTDEDVGKLEASEQLVNRKLEADKLLAIAKKESQAAIARRNDQASRNKVKKAGGEK